MDIKSLSEENFRKIILNLFEPLALYKIIRNEKGEAEDFLYVDVNIPYGESMGKDREELIGHTFRSVWPEDSVFFENMKKAVTRNSPTHCVAYSEGYDRYCYSVALCIDEDHLAVLLRDVTAWEHAKQDLSESQTEVKGYKQELRALVTKLTLSEENVRRSVAVNIHDDLGYSLVNLKNHLENLKNRVTDENKECAEEALKKSKEIINLARRITFQISSPLLYEVGLGGAIKQLGETMFLPRDINFTYNGQISDIGISGNLTVILFQITRELFANILKHAEATAVTASLRKEDNKISLVVDDNGKGFTEGFKESGATGEKFGLFSIRERLSFLGGKLFLFTEPGMGSTLVVSVYNDENGKNTKKI